MTEAFAEVRRRVRVHHLLAMIAVLALAVWSVGFAVPATASVSFINSQRTAGGLAPVSAHDGLSSLALDHARDMADRGNLFHSTNLGGKVAAVVPDWRGVGENVGVGASVEEVNNAFMASSGHRANIMGSYTLAGVGAVTGPDGRVWVTQMFARVAEAAPAPPAPPRPAEPRVARVRPPAPPPEPVAPPVNPFLQGVIAVDAEAPKLGSWRRGYLTFSPAGVVTAHDGAHFIGSLPPEVFTAPIVAAASAPGGDGYWLAAKDGGVFALGTAQFFGSAGQQPLSAEVVGMAARQTGAGYWLVGKDGAVFAFGDAAYHGGLGGIPLGAPVRAITATPSGEGYWLVTEDGGVFAFGDAPYHGGIAGMPLNAPIVGMAATRSGDGYWLLAEDGGVFAFGRAEHLGGLAGEQLGQPARALLPHRGGAGYMVVLADGQMRSFGEVVRTTSRGFAISGTTLPA